MAVCHLRYDGSGTLRTEGLGVCACASGQPSITFGLQKVISFGPKVMVFEVALLSVYFGYAWLHFVVALQTG